MRLSKTVVRAANRPYRTAFIFLVVFALFGTSGCAFILRSSLPDPSTGAAQSNGRSWAPAISGDGRYTVFLSDASNLVPGDTNGVTDVFVRDNSTSTVTRYTDGSVVGDSRPTISEDGTKIAYTVDQGYGDGSRRCRVGVVDVATVTLVYFKWAFNSDTVECNKNPTLSANGKVVAYEENFSFGFNDAYVSSQTSSTIASPNRTNNTLTGYLSNLRLDPAGLFLLFDSPANNIVSGDTNGTDDVFEYKVSTDTTTRRSLTSTGAQANGSSGYASYCLNSGSSSGIVFASFASNLVSGDTNGHQDIFERLLPISGSGTFRLIAGNGDSSLPQCSDDSGSMFGARFMSFISKATDLVPGDTNTALDVFTYDAETSKITRTSVDVNLNQANGGSSYAQISANGRWVSYESDASNLVGADTNGVTDVFTGNTFRPTITSISPSLVFRPTSQTITITGTGFVGPIKLFASDSVITFSNIALVDTTKITATVSVPLSAKGGQVTIFVVTDGTAVFAPGGAAAQCTCFSSVILLP